MNMPTPNAGIRKSNPLVFWLRVIVAIAVVAGATWGLVYWLKSRISAKSYTSDSTARQFILANDVLNVPLNMMRFEEQRQRETLKQIDLALLWPQGAGYSPANAVHFEDPEQTANLIFVTLIKRDMTQEMTERFQPIYRRLLTGQARSGPAGLKIQALKPGSGYDGEELAGLTFQVHHWFRLSFE